ncbi:MAG: glycosyltransferase [Paludibacteraceae bacterium]|nr:glycosyltransferase [Paludibacteraceae bacterium]
MSTKKTKNSPDYIFETSWEVCNRVGGIYTVLSSKAETLQKEHKDKVIFIGPDFWHENKCPFFTESASLLKDWKENAQKSGLSVRVGRWKVPGKPITILVDFKPFLNKETLDNAYASAWEKFGVDSLHAYGDYNESAAFGIASGLAMTSLYKHFKAKDADATFIAHFNEWMTAFGLFIVNGEAPEIGTVFTTHATSIGRSIAGNSKPLYGQLQNYNGDQMAQELNMEAKHSVEKAAAHLSDCFTTVSEVTGRECAQLLDKAPDVVTPNGFEKDFVPDTAAEYAKKRNAARKALQNVTEKLTGTKLSEDVVFVGTCGRCEYKNKGIDLFIDSLHKLAEERPEKEVVGFIMVPSFVKGPREHLQKALKTKGKNDALPMNFITHHLHEPGNDAILNAIRWYGFPNRQEDKVKIIYIPSYLNGTDGIFNKTYYDLLIGLDLTIFPSYYEPWGYTPLESIAFSIPTITTNLSGFGQWVLETDEKHKEWVLNRTDDNYLEVRDNITDLINNFIKLDKDEVSKLKKAAKALSQKALWKNFIAFYKETYNFALQKASKRNNS